MLPLLRRISTLLLVAVVITVPALARAQQEISATAPQTHETSRFSHGCDSTAEKIAVAQPLAVAHVPGVADHPRETVRAAIVHADEPLPVVPRFESSHALRAPPLSLNA